MAKQNAKYQFPIKGVVKTMGFEDHPADAMVDALNVMPWDRSGRLRLCQRTGTSKLYADPVGTGGVKAMMQVTLGSQPQYGRTVESIVNPLPEVWAEHFVGWVIYVGDGMWALARPGLWLPSANGYGDALAQIGIGSGFVPSEVAGGPDGDAFLRITPGPANPGDAQSRSLALGVQEVVTPADHTAFVWMNMDAAPAGTTVYLSARYKPTYLDYSRLAGMIHLAITDRTTVRVIFGNPDSGLVLFTNVCALAGWVKLRIDTIPVDGTATSEQRIHHFYINDVRIFSVQTATAAGPEYDTSDWEFTQHTFGVAFTTLSGYVDFDWAAGYEMDVADSVVGLKRDNKIVYGVGGDVALGDLNSVTTSTAGSAKLDVMAPFVSVASSSLKAYIVDGTNTKVLDLKTNTLSDLTATAGVLPTRCKLACMYRDRLVLAAPEGEEHCFFFSRVGHHTDFDYTILNDPAAAFEGNASTAGHIGDPIVALIPLSDDQLLISCDHQLWIVRGDPADGGSIDLLADVGVLGASAWCKDPNGVVYFVGTGGLYRMIPGVRPECLSNDKWNEFFSRIDRTRNAVLMAWDLDGQGAYIFVTPYASGPSTALWFDGRLSAGDARCSLWPIAIPANHGPLSVLVYDGDGATDRRILLGGRDGCVRGLSHVAKTDDGETVSSYAILGPYTLGEVEAVMEWIDVVMSRPIGSDAASDTHMLLQVLSGQSAEQAMAAPYLTRSKTISTTGRQGRWLNRTRGVTFFLKVSNSVAGKTFAVEKVDFGLSSCGIVRRR